MTDQVDTETTNIFENEAVDNKAATDKVQEKTPDLDSIFKDKLEAIKGVNGEQKYKDVMTALDALKHTQDHVKTLEDENKALRESKTQSDTIEEALKRLSAKDTPTEKTNSEEIDAEKIKSLTAETIKELDAAKKRETNKDEVSKALIAKYGSSEKAKEVYLDKAKELGVSVDMLKSLAETSPKAVMAYFGSSTSDSTFSKESTINTQSLNNGKNEEIDYISLYTKAGNTSLDKWKEAGNTLGN